MAAKTQKWRNCKIVKLFSRLWNKNQTYGTEITYYMSSEILNLTHSLTHSVADWNAILYICWFQCLNLVLTWKDQDFNTFVFVLLPIECRSTAVLAFSPTRWLTKLIPSVLYFRNAVFLRCTEMTSWIYNRRWKILATTAVSLYWHRRWTQLLFFLGGGGLNENFSASRSIADV